MLGSMLLGFVVWWACWWESLLGETLSAGLSQAAFGRNRNPKESGGIWRNQEKIQEFLSHRNSCKKILWWRPKTGIPATSPKPRSCEKILRKRHEKKSSGILAGTFFYIKKTILKTGIGNLGNFNKNSDANVKEQYFGMSKTCFLVCTIEHCRINLFVFLSTNSLQITFYISLSCWHGLSVCIPTHICWLVICVPVRICLWDVFLYASVHEMHSCTHLLEVCVSVHVYWWYVFLELCVSVHIYWWYVSPNASVGNVSVGGMHSRTHLMAMCLPTHIAWQDALLNASVGKMHYCMHLLAIDIW